MSWTVDIFPLSFQGILGPVAPKQPTPRTEDRQGHTVLVGPLNLSGERDVKVGLFAVLAACGQKQAEEEFVVIDPEPISHEPMQTGKYK
jgi:hypothetical protein